MSDRAADGAAASAAGTLGAMPLPRRLFTLLPLTALLPDIAAAAPTVLPLWPEGVPPATRADAPAARGDIGPEQVDAGGGIRHVSVPTLTVVPPAVDRPNGTAVIVCPGGGYSYRRAALKRLLVGPLVGRQSSCSGADCGSRTWRVLRHNLQQARARLRATDPRVRHSCCDRFLSPLQARVLTRLY